ncbi:uncharacterized protein LOC116385105 [Anarrhichthys ocellatus]|uniref:uncharacterized protein LOC116385105 n=1 Tax=Anarrhichthys ocellatus TaxID=433405 RepID=UPI0012ED2E6F|nr:uncharacterized protein LOC116385105 [Anarrhichthys ocellatus]
MLSRSDWSRDTEQESDWWISLPEKVSNNILSSESCPGGLGQSGSSGSGWIGFWVVWLELDQFLDAVQDDLVGAAAVFGSVRGRDGQDPRHLQLVPLLLHGEPVLFQPPPDAPSPPPQLRRVQGAGLRWEEGGLETLRGLLVCLLQDLHLLHGVTHHHLHRRPALLLPEVHQDQTGGDRVHVQLFHLKTSHQRKTMDCNRKSSHCPQCPAASAMGRRTVTSEESIDDKVELTMGVKTSKPKVSRKLSSGFCEDREASVSRSGVSDSPPPPPPLCLSPATAAAQTQTPSTKPKAGALVAYRQLTDGSEAASLRDPSPLPLLTLKGSVSLSSSDPRRSFSLHTSITGEAPQHEGQRLKRKRTITREGNKSQYNRDLDQQVEERKEQMERERSRNAVDEQKHNDTEQHTIWGMPGSGAPNYYLGTAKRTRSLHAAGILPQEQVNKAPSYQPSIVPCNNSPVY